VIVIRHGRSEVLCGARPNAEVNDDRQKLGFKQSTTGSAIKWKASTTGHLNDEIIVHELNELSALLFPDTGLSSCSCDTITIVSP